MTEPGPTATVSHRPVPASRLVSATVTNALRSGHTARSPYLQAADSYSHPLMLTNDLAVHGQ